MKKLCLLLSALVLNGCLHATPPQPAQKPALQKAPLSATLVERSIVKGKTTREEIAASLGAPNSVVSNKGLPSPEVLAKATAPLPPIARTVEFWHYWTTPSERELERAAVTGSKPKVFRLMLFMDKDGVAVDYLTETRELEFNQ